MSIVAIGYPFYLMPVHFEAWEDFMVDKYIIQSLSSRFGNPGMRRPRGGLFCLSHSPLTVRCTTPGSQRTSEICSSPKTGLLNCNARVPTGWPRMVSGCCAGPWEALGVSSGAFGCSFADSDGCRRGFEDDMVSDRDDCRRFVSSGAMNGRDDAFWRLGDLSSALICIFIGEFSYVSLMLKGLQGDLENKHASTYQYIKWCV